MSEMQEPVLEHAAPKADQNQRLDGHSADASLPESNPIVKTVIPETEIAAQGREVLRRALADQSLMRWLFLGTVCPSRL